MLDQDARKGCIKIEYNNQDLSVYSLTVDTQDDLERCHALMGVIGKSNFMDIGLSDILGNLNQLSKVDEEMVIKLPDRKQMKYSEFVEMQWNQGFDVIEPVTIDV